MPICDKLGYERGGIRGIGQGYREMYGLESNIKNGGIPKRSLLITLRMMPVMLSSFSGTYRALIATVGKISFSNTTGMQYFDLYAFPFIFPGFHLGSFLTTLMASLSYSGAKPRITFMFFTPPFSSMVHT